MLGDGARVTTLGAKVVCNRAYDLLFLARVMDVFSMLCDEWVRRFTVHGGVLMFILKVSCELVL